MNRFSLLPLAFLAVLYSSNLAASETPRQSDADDVKRLRDRLIKSEIDRLRLSLKVARLENKPEEEFSHLVGALKSEFPQVFGEALRELSLLMEERRIAAVKPVLKRFGKRDDLYEIPAIEFLARVPSPEARGMIRNATASPSASVRRAAASALRTATDDAAFAALVSLLGDDDRDVRLTALEALGVTKRPGAVKPLVGLLGSEQDAEIVKQAVDALGAIASPEAVDPLIALLEKTGVKDVRWSCIDSLGRIGERRAASKLHAFLKAGRPMDIRQVTIQALGKLKDSTALEDLAEVLRKDEAEILRQEAATSIGLMARPEALDGILLPAYLAEKSDAVRLSTWKAMLDLSGKSFEANLRLATALLDKGLRMEAEEVCTTRLHALKLEEAQREAYLKLEERVASAAFGARDAKAALPHFRQLSAHAPDRIEVLQQIAACYRELKDLDSCLKTLRDVDSRLTARADDWWANRLQIVSALQEAGDPGALITEAYALFHMNPPPHPEARRKALLAALQVGTLQLTAPLASKDPAVRAKGLEALKPHGLRIIDALADLVENAEGARPELLEAGNAVTGTQFDPQTAAPDARKAAAAAWRAWRESRKNP